GELRGVGVAVLAFMLLVSAWAWSARKPVGRARGSIAAQFALTFRNVLAAASSSGNPYPPASSRISRMTAASSSPAPPPTPPPAPAAPARLTPGLRILLAARCGLLVGSLYFSQPLTLDIARDLGLEPSTAGFIVTLTQLGYCAGLLLLTPLGDRVENKRLVL